MENNNKSSFGWWVGGIIIILVIIVAVVMLRSPSTPAQVETQTQTPVQTPATTTEATTTTPVTADKPYTMAKVAMHNTASDCWTVISGKVYDITKAIPNHEGGEAIIQACGIDGTTLFSTRNNGTPHPKSAQKDLANYYLADLQQ